MACLKRSIDFKMLLKSESVCENEVSGLGKDRSVSQLSERPLESLISHQTQMKHWGLL